MSLDGQRAEECVFSRKTQVGEAIRINNAVYRPRSVYRKKRTKFPSVKEQTVS